MVHLSPDERQFQLLVENLPAGVFIQTKGRFSFVNEAFREILGIREDSEILGVPVLDRVPERLRAQVMGRIRSLNEKRASVERAQEFFLRSDGSEVPVEVSAIPFRFEEEDGALVFVRETWEDHNFRRLLDLLPAGVFVREGERLVLANQETLRILGVSDEADLVGTKFLDHLSETDKANTLSRIHLLELGLEVPKEVEVTVRRADGSTAPVEVKPVPFQFQGKSRTLVFLRDLTDQHEAQREMERKDELVRMTGEMAKVGGWSFNLGSGRGSWTDAVAAIHDLPPGTPIDISKGLDYYTHDSRPIVEEAVGKLVRDGTPYDLVVPLITAAGREKWVRTQGFPFMREGEMVEVRGTMQDVTELHQQQVALEEEKDRLLITLKSIGDGVITTDVEGRVVLMSHSAEDLTGWSQAEAGGRLLVEILPLIHEWTKQPLENPVLQVLRDGKTRELANHTLLVNRAGVELIIADSAAPIKDQNGQITGVVLVFRDMTEKQRLADALQRAQNLESIGLLAAGIAHDFNNLLSGLFGQVQLAADKVKAHRAEEAAVNLERALGVFERARDLTGQLMTFSKGGAPVRTTFDLGVLVRRTAVFALSGSNVGVRFQISPDLWPCEGDENQLAQALDNLVINARQAMPDGGTVAITVENRQAASKELAIIVKDEGAGIAPDVLGRIFDPFFSTKPSGHGLGLSAVQSIVQRHEGRVEVQSSSSGTVFTVFLPVS